MGEVTGVEWTDHTANFWIGCNEVSPGCDNCYARRGSARLGAQHGLKLWEEDRYITKRTVDNVRTWNKRAKAAGERRRVFCMSYGDLFEERAEFEPIRSDIVWPLFEECEWLDFLCLTKRPENIKRMLPKHWLRQPRRNVWLGTTCENQEWADTRIPLLLQVPSVIHFASYEPALGPVHFGALNDGSWYDAEGSNSYNALKGTAYHFAHGHYDHGLGGGPKLDWIIVGGESGPKARDFDVNWARDVVAECRATGVAVFVKQMGDQPVGRLLHIHKAKGGDMAEWPEDLRVREFPKVAA